MNKRFWLKKANQVILSQNKSNVEKAEEIVELFGESNVSASK